MKKNQSLDKILINFLIFCGYNLLNNELFQQEIIGRIQEDFWMNIKDFFKH